MAVHELVAFTRCAPTTAYSETPDTLHTSRTDCRDSVSLDLAAYLDTSPPICLLKLSKI
jgi:hypothetical protein